MESRPPAKSIKRVRRILSSQIMLAEVRMQCSLAKPNVNRAEPSVISSVW